MKHLTGLGTDWDLFLRPAMLTYNSYTTPNLDALSPFELVLGHKAKIVPKMEITPEIQVSQSFHDAKNTLQKKLMYFREHLQKFRDTR